MIARDGLVQFATEVIQARREFRPGDWLSWLTFYTAKQSAFDKLKTNVAAVAEVADFWRYVQNMTPAQWIPIIEAEIERVMRDRLCAGDCGKLLKWSGRFCAECRQARRREQNRNAQERRALRERLRKCPACKTEPLEPRRRFCDSCRRAREAEKKRRQRSQKSRQDGSCPELNRDFTRETKSANGRSASTTRFGRKCALSRDKTALAA